MIKVLLKLPLCFVLGLSLSFSQAQKIEFLPEVKALFEIEPLDPARLERNFFIVFNGITFPRDNYDQIFATVFRNSYKKNEDSIKSGEMFHPMSAEVLNDHLNKGEKLLTLQPLSSNGWFKLSTKDYLVCADYLNINCIKETVDKKEFINELRASNSILLKRYTELLKQVDHNDVIKYPDRSYWYDLRNRIPSYQMYLRLSELQLAEAILQLNAGNFEQGLVALEHERAMIELNLNSNLSHIEAMIMVSSMQRLDQTLNAILAEGFFDSMLKDPRIEHLFAPYSKAERQAAFRAYKRDVFGVFSPTYKVLLKDLGNLSQLALNKEDEDLALIWLNSLNKLSPHLVNRYYSIDKKKTVFDKERTEFIKQLADDDETYYAYTRYRSFYGADRATKWEQETLEHYFAEKDISLASIISYFNDDSTVAFYNQYYLALQQYMVFLENNPYSKATEQFAFEMNTKFTSIMMSSDYLRRMDEQSNYHHLVYLKYRIERDKIRDADIPHFLESMGKLAKHPVTQEPYTWNAEERTLSIPLSESKFLPSSVRDGKSTHFKVWIR